MDYGGFQLKILYETAIITLNLGTRSDYECVGFNYQLLFEYVSMQLKSIPEWVTEVEIYASTPYDLFLEVNDTDILSLLPSHIKKLKVRCEDSCDFVDVCVLPPNLEVLDMRYPYSLEDVAKELPKSLHTLIWGCDVVVDGVLDTIVIPSYVKFHKVFD